MTEEKPVEHRAICPVCGRLAVRETTWANAGVTEAAYLCEKKHAWTTKWVEAA